MRTPSKRTDILFKSAFKVSLSYFITWVNNYHTWKVVYFRQPPTTACHPIKPLELIAQRNVTCFASSEYVMGSWIPIVFTIEYGSPYFSIFWTSVLSHLKYLIKINQVYIIGQLFYLPKAAMLPLNFSVLCINLHNKYK